MNWSLKDPVGFQVTHSRLCTPGTVGTWQNPYPSGGKEEEGREGGGREGRRGKEGNTLATCTNKGALSCQKYMSSK